VDDVSARFREGETLGLSGRIGLGQKHAGTADSPPHQADSDPRFQWVDLRTATGSEVRRPFAATMQIIFQDPLARSIPATGSSGVNREPLILHREGVTRDARRQCVRDLLRAVGNG